MAVRDQIPVVVVNDDLGPPAGPRLSYVANDEMAGAQLAASQLATLLHGRGSIAIMGISPRLDSGLARDEDLELALKSIAPEIRIVERRFGDSVITHQQQIAQQLLDQSATIDAIVALTATATRGAYYAKLASDSHSKVHLIGFDQDILVPIQSGDVDAVVAQNTPELGRIAMQNLAAEMRGTAVAAHTSVTPLLITQQNVSAPAAKRLWSFAEYGWSAP
jgi:ribose transport system substrate-binding protein